MKFGVWYAKYKGKRKQKSEKLFHCDFNGYSKDKYLFG